MRQDNRDVVWITEVESIEVHLGGDESGAYPMNQVIMEQFWPQRKELMARSIDYLSSHIPGHAGVLGNPDIQWIEFGTTNYGEHNEIEIYFNDEKTYVLWAVRFRVMFAEGGSQFTPVGLSRRDW